MTVHITARVAWHMDGWNGHICRHPEANTYCVGPNSYPGQLIGEKRDLTWERAHAGLPCHKLDGIPPCIYSANAFGDHEVAAQASPPDFFRDETRPRLWQLPAATVSIWPYEEMYFAEGVTRPGGGFDYDRRLEAARAYFNAITPDESLIFYYANYSNPFSEDDRQCYVLVGMSRIKTIGQELFYENCSPHTRERYGGGFVWQRNVTSHYPDQGLRLPYHLYLDQPDVLDKFLLIPSNSRTCKYATRHLTDDDALELVEQFLGAVIALEEMDDRSENWSLRREWLESLISSLWNNRGLYPGLPHVLDAIEFHKAIPLVKEKITSGQETEAKEGVFAYLAGTAASLFEHELPSEEARRIRRKWALLETTQQKMLADLLPRFDIRVEQIGRVIGDGRERYGLYASLDEILENPYLLCEGYVGDDADDVITFSRIDRGVFPSPQLGEGFLMDRDDPQRLRALCVDALASEGQHTFLDDKTVLDKITRRMSYQPEWKTATYSERYFDVDKEILSGALTFRTVENERYIYLRSVFEDERAIEEGIRFLVRGPDIQYRIPMTDDIWHDFLYVADSDLALNNPEEYEAAIDGQVEVCGRIFHRPICVLSGGAGTGKTTVIRALIDAIARTEGTNSAFQLLAPTGKAADRIRSATGKPAATVHSFLAQRGWLNDNLTLKRSGGQRETAIATYIVDEASMLDLTLMAGLFRAIDWSSVKRLILVGDPNQLPPIGRGRVFADIIDWLQQKHPESIGILETNIRQMENRLNDRGQGIIDLATLYTRDEIHGEHDSLKELDREEFLRRLQIGGEIDSDLRILYWRDPDDLANLLLAAIVEDMQADLDTTFDPEKPWVLWNKALGISNSAQGSPEYHQVISPYRGEEFGIEHLNRVLQVHIKGRQPDHHRLIDGIALFDKVLQFRNRSRSNPLYAYNNLRRAVEAAEIYNGELGIVYPHGFDSKAYRNPDFRVRRFQVAFARKEQLRVNYGEETGNLPNGRDIPAESVQENLELAYAISVHKAQGSEFQRVYFVLPKHKSALLSPELFYTGITRAKRHCTIFVEEDISSLITLLRPERSHLERINSSLFLFNAVPKHLQDLSWYEEGKVHSTLTSFMVRSKSEVIIANLLAERELDFRYEQPLFASDGSFYLPDFTITWRGQKLFWEHLGKLHNDEYRARWEKKKRWYDQHFPGQLITTVEGEDLTTQVQSLMSRHFV